MENSIVNTGIQAKTNSTVAISSQVMDYGRAIGLSRHRITVKSPGINLKNNFKFYYGEYVAGILFISALFLYTLLMPRGIVNPFKYVYAMFDRFLKKTLDFGGALLGIILTLPIWIIFPILIKLTSSGPVFYIQDRIGVDRRRRSRRLYKANVDDDNRFRERRRINNYGRPFKVIKFRTMVRNAEKESGPVWATSNDSRVTTLGRFMRKTRIDEIPQFVNILRGDMSLVGPRPERLFFIKDLTTKVPRYNARLRVKPGITGMAQVNSGYDSSLESGVEKVEQDVKYIRTWSIASDIKILLKTVVVVITGRGAF
jgi:lipopolysaccharide/colanic/teichoic acid biosynthesis glycosyltransferase